ncbi:protein kinase [Streptacidiphilus sp. P02-A3a]|uniref:protein kinase domain-containing protein n=1 Tax=Streptacidiphilus sp. P02-A3a TaxID=2704468 RepID=UPI0015F789AE|nr:protein kinase [Streptacidiphilus sp. P02-A3a]QMU73364.1 protein kinase [Streptacidiphilus sp. P02-A3a]
MSVQGSDGGGAARTVGHGRYTLRDLLGQGGMATVHLADDTVLDRPVAIKTMLGEMSREPSFRERFRREAQAVARLNHANIVQVHDSGEDLNEDGVLVPFIVMEYVEGSTLSSVLRKDISQHGAMPTDRALRITGEVLAALAASHEQGLVHRDIKPANVMVTNRGVVKVMDFGIARAMQSGVTSMTQTGMVVGTPQYLSPEQALGRSVDARSDLYSVGCLLFELLTGRLPFESESALGMAYQHVQETPPAPSSFNAAVSPGVDALVARALRKDPAHRFPDADAMRAECERVAGAAGSGVPQVIGDGRGPGAPGVGGSGANAMFPQAQGQLGTPPPAPQQPYPSMAQQPMPPRFGGQQYPNPPYPNGQFTGQPYTGQQQAVPQGPPPYGQGVPPQQPPGYQQRPQYQTPRPQPQPARTPPPYAPRPSQQTPPPYRPAPQRPGPRPMPQPVRNRPAPVPVPVPPARPGNSAGRGCGIAAIIIGVIVGIILLIGLIGALAAQHQTNDPSGSGLGRTAPVATVSGEFGASGAAAASLG